MERAGQVTYPYAVERFVERQGYVAAIPYKPAGREAMFLDLDGPRWQPGHTGGAWRAAAIHHKVPAQGLTDAQLASWATANGSDGRNYATAAIAWRNGAGEVRHFPVVVEGSYQRYNRALRRHDTVRALPSDGIQPGSWGRHVSASRPNNPALDFVPHRGFVPINDVIDDARRGARGSGGMLLLGGVVAAAGGLALAIATRPRAGD